MNPTAVIPTIINRSWLDRLCKEGTPCPHAPGAVADCTLDYAICKELGS